MESTRAQNNHLEIPYGKNFNLSWPKAAFNLPPWFTKFNHATKLFNAIRPLCESIDTYVPGMYIAIKFDGDMVMMCKIAMVELAIQNVLEEMEE